MNDHPRRGALISFCLLESLLRDFRLRSFFNVLARKNELIKYTSRIEGRSALMKSASEASELVLRRLEDHVVDTRLGIVGGCCRGRVGLVAFFFPRLVLGGIRDWALGDCVRHDH